MSKPPEAPERLTDFHSVHTGKVYRPLAERIRIHCPVRPQRRIEPVEMRRIQLRNVGSKVRGPLCCNDTRLSQRNDCDGLRRFVRGYNKNSTILPLVLLFGRRRTG